MHRQPCRQRAGLTASFYVALVLAAFVSDGAHAQVLTVAPGQVSIAYPTAAAEVFSRAERSPAASIHFVASPEGEMVGQISPDTRRADAFYPLLTRIGRGWLIYRPGLASSSQSLAIELPAAWQVSPSGTGAEGGFIYVGPDATDQGVVTDPRVRNGVRETVSDAARNANAYYDLALGAGRAPEALWVIGLLPSADDNLFVADVTANAVVNVQVRADLDPDQFEDLAFLIAHEVFHLRARALWDDAALADWEREGAAEYAAVRYFQESGRSETARRRMERHLNDCLRDISAEGLEAADTQTVRYSCGAVYAWIVDISLQTGDGSSGDLLAHLPMANGRLASPRTATPFDQALLALRHGSTDVAQAISTALAEADWKVVAEPPSGMIYAMTAIAPAAFAVCADVEGVSLETDGTWVVHTDAGCGPSGPAPQIVALDALSTRDAGEAIFKHVAAGCVAGIRVVFNGRGGETSRTYVCDSPPPPPRTIYRLASH